MAPEFFGPRASRRMRAGRPRPIARAPLPQPHGGAANPALAKPLPNAICFPKRTPARRKHHALQAHLGRLPSRHALDAAGAVRRERPARPQGAHALCRGRAGRAAMGRQERRQFRAALRRRPGRREACPGSERPRRHHGRARPLFRRQAGQDPLQRPASAPQGHGGGRGRRRGHLRHSRRRLEAQRPRSQQRDAAHLQ